MHLAARSDAVESAEALLDAGADTSVKNEDGRRALQVAAFSARTRNLLMIMKTTVHLLLYRGESANGGDDIKAWALVPSRFKLLSLRLGSYQISASLASAVLVLIWIRPSTTQDASQTPIALAWTGESYVVVALLISAGTKKRTGNHSNALRRQLARGSRRDLAADNAHATCGPHARAGARPPATLVAHPTLWPTTLRRAKVLALERIRFLSEALVAEGESALEEALSVLCFGESRDGEDNLDGASNVADADDADKEEDPHARLRFLVRPTAERRRELNGALSFMRETAAVASG